MAVTSATTPPVSTTTGNTATATTSALGKDSIAQNFTTFLQLLTTQLQNQNPLDPLDTNQFTQQLVQFAQVEQQMNMNSSLTSLIALQKATQTSAALGFLGSTVVVDGDTAQLSGGSASWSFTADRPASAVINVSNSSGQVVYSETRTVTAGAQDFSWNGRSSAGQTMPDGDYKISIVAKDANGQVAAIATEVQGTVDGVDLNHDPPVLKVGTRSFTLDKIKQVRRPGA